MLNNFTKKFDAVLTVPLVFYVVVIVGLIISATVKITPDKVTSTFANPAIWNSALRSSATSIISSLLVVIVAVPAGYILSRQRIKAAGFFDSIIDLPIVMPPLVIGLCILIFFSSTNVGRFLDRGLAQWLAELTGRKASSSGFFIFNVGGIIAVQFVVGCAFAIRVIKSGFDEFDHRLEELAMTLGASPWKSFFKVSLPNTMPAIIAALVITWARVFGLFGPIQLLCGTMRFKTEILPTSIYLEYSIGNLNGALVLGVFMILTSIITIAVFKQIGGNKNKI
jgi:molybdate transport system permease protein